MGWVTDEAGLKEKKETYSKRRKTYLKTFPYFCVQCSNFSYAFQEYCEKCGFKGSIRKATKFDYDIIFKDKQDYKTFLKNIFKNKQEKTEYKPSRKTDIYKYWEKEAVKKRVKKVSPTKVTSGISCVNCGKPMLPTWSVCAYCGQKIALQESSTISEVKPVKSIIPQIEKQPPSSSSLPKAQKEEEWKEKIVQPKKLDEEPKHVEKIHKQPIDVPISPPIPPTKKVELAPEKTKKIEPQIITCPFCDNQINQKQNYCSQCGYILKN
jgi:uncharacterized OB-fold protein